MDKPDPFSDNHDVRPQVSVRRGGMGVWLFAGVLAAVSGGIFYSLQMHRLETADEGMVHQVETSGMIASPPPLVIPAGLGPSLTDQMPVQQAYALPSQAPIMGYAQQPGPRTAVQAMPSAAVPVFAPPTAPAPLAPDGIIFQPSSSSAGAMPAKTEENANAGVPRVRSGRFQDPGTTVPQGSVIQAVMETALDSTRAGFARAIVSRDVMSFDGSRVLIPRGSKLVGEYKADISLGQKRALVQWHRLTLPDGTIIDVDSPAADPLGRAGIKGKVNTHFFERFSGAILQSVLDVGVRAATSEATNNTVIIGTPTSTQTALTTQQNSIQPTLKVRQGASVTVFVARDLVFS